MPFDDYLGLILKELQEINIREKVKEITPKPEIYNIGEDINDVKNLLEKILEKLEDMDNKLDDISTDNRK